MNYLAITLLFFSVIVGGLGVYYMRPGEKIVRMLLGFSGAFLLALAFTKIIPGIFSGPESKTLGYFVLLGFFIQLIIEYFAKGIDHGHQHEKPESHDHKHIINPWGLLIGISVHAFFEGMPFSGHFHQHELTQNTLLLGIIIHKIPIAVVLMSLFINAGYSKIKSTSLIIGFALAAPLGSLASWFAGDLFADSEHFYRIIMAMVVGIFLHIATVILFENDKDHKFNFFKFITIVIGIFAALLITNLH
jgi:zinc transporter ZupT